MVVAESPRETVERRVIQMQTIHKSEDNWRGVVKGGVSDHF
jgi:hypothetical protein